MDTVYAVIHVEYVFIAHILHKYWMRNLYHLSMMYVTVYNMSFNSNCCILAAELNYRFTVPPKKIMVYEYNVAICS